MRKLVALTPVPAPACRSTTPVGRSSAARPTSPKIATRSSTTRPATGCRAPGSAPWRSIRSRTRHAIAFAAYLTAWSKTDFSATVRGMPLPVKVIVGEHDPALNTSVMQATFLTSYPHCELEVMANAGHYPMHETPLALASSIENFLRRRTRHRQEVKRRLLPGGSCSQMRLRGALRRRASDASDRTRPRDRHPRRATAAAALSISKWGRRPSSLSTSLQAMGIETGSPGRARSE